MTVEFCTDFLLYSQELDSNKSEYIMSNTASNSKNSRRGPPSGSDESGSSRRQPNYRYQQPHRAYQPYRQYYNHNRPSTPSMDAPPQDMSDCIGHGPTSNPFGPPIGGRHHMYKHRRGGGNGGGPHYAPSPPAQAAIPMMHPSMPPPPPPRMIPQVYNFNCSVPMVPKGPPIPIPPSTIAAQLTEHECELTESGNSSETPQDTTSIATQTPPTLAARPGASIPLKPQNYPVLGYYDRLSITMWQYFMDTKQSSPKYAKKVHFRNALHMIISSVFEQSKLFIVGSSINGFGSDTSDMDLCLTVTSQELQAKPDTEIILNQLMIPLKKCSFIKNCCLIKAKVPILKFRDQLAAVDCDLNVNNVVGIYNTHLLAMYTRTDWRVRPLGMFVKHWAQKMDIHDGSRGRLSTYPLLLMLIQYLQHGCQPPVVPNLQARFPKIFTYERPVSDFDMRLQLPWAELCSSNPMTLSDLFAGFINYYANFNFAQWAISIKSGQPLPIDISIRCLPPHEQKSAMHNFKIFVEEPFCQANAARSLHDENVLSHIQQAFHRTNRALKQQKPLETVWSSPHASATATSQPHLPSPRPSSSTSTIDGPVGQWRG